MGVSSRHTFLAGLTAASMLALAGAAYAGGGMGGGTGGGSPCATSGCGGSGGGAGLPGHGIGSGPGPVLPGVSGGGSSGCCGLQTGTHVPLPGVKVAGPNISVTAPNVSVSHGNIVYGHKSVIRGGKAAAGGETTFLSGGGAYFAPQGIAPSALSKLNVTGGEERYTETVTEQVPVTEEICVDEIREQIAVLPVRAVCLDDSGTPHPASQVTGAREIGASYTGEVYRCMAGTAMQVTIGRLDGNQADFSQAESFACRKGEALVRRATGELTCATQTPQRDCNERSLLRQYGPGIKLIQTRSQVKACVPETRTRMQTVKRQVERVRAHEGGPIVLDGGVGQGVF